MNSLQYILKALAIDLPFHFLGANPNKKSEVVDHIVQGKGIISALSSFPTPYILTINNGVRFLVLDLNGDLESFTVDEGVYFKGRIEMYKGKHVLSPFVFRRF